MKRRILAIDDSLTLREFISRSLTGESKDYEVILAKDGREGLAQAATIQPDLILLDYLLPDLNGDEVCRRLQEDPATTAIPVLMMSSSAEEMQRTAGLYPNVVRSIAKPFTPQLLGDSVNHIVRQLDARDVPQVELQATVPTEDPASGKPKKAAVRKEVFSGDAGRFSLLSAFELIEQDLLTGVFELKTSRRPIQLYFRSGRILLGTVRSAKAYLQAGSLNWTAEQRQSLKQASEKQDEDGSPIFLNLAEQKVLPFASAVTHCQEQTFRLMANAWIMPRLQFRFRSLSELPPFLQTVWPYDGSMTEWAMEALRHVGDGCLYALAWGDLSGIPAYTRRGYERVQQVPLNDEEIRFAELVSPSRSLVRIAESMNVETETAQRILFRFLKMEILEYWPASLLRGG